MFKYINKTSYFIIIDVIFALAILLANIINYSYFIWILIGMFLIYMCKNKIDDLVTHQIILISAFNIFYDILWRKTSLNIPINCKYIVDVIGIIMIFKMLFYKNRFKRVVNDFIFWIIISFVIISMFVAIVNKIPLINFLMSLRIYIRFFPAYLILSTGQLKYNKYHLCILIIANLILIPIQSIISSFDDVSGIFGIRNVHILLLLLIIIVALLTTYYCKKEITTIKFVVGIIIVFLICGIGEIKLGMAIIPIEIICIILLNTINPFKLIVSIIVCVVMINIGLKVLIKVSPQFTSFFNHNTIKQNIIDYTMKPNNPEYKLGRFENIVYSYNNILDTESKKITGLGIGNAMPSENYYYELDKHSKGRKINTIYTTKLYKQYGPYFGYHFSSMNILFLESGFIGILVYMLIISTIIYRSIILIKKSKFTKDKALGNSCIALSVSLLFLMFYYNYILDRGAIMMITFIFAIVTNRRNITKVNLNRG